MGQGGERRINEGKEEKMTARYYRGKNEKRNRESNGG